MVMEDLLEITKGYFKKNKEEKEEIFEELYTQIFLVTVQQEFTQEEIERILKNLIEKMELKERYEIAELFQQILNKLKEEYYQIPDV